MPIKTNMKIKVRFSQYGWRDNNHTATSCPSDKKRLFGGPEQAFFGSKTQENAFIEVRNADRTFASKIRPSQLRVPRQADSNHWEPAPSGLFWMFAQRNSKWSLQVISDSTLDWPRATDFVEPYFFFSNRGLTEVTFVSPSVETVLGYDPKGIPGLSYNQFLCEGDPLNDDVPECQQADLSDGSSIYALRGVLDSGGTRRILSIHTVGVSEFEGGPIVRRHNIAKDVTESVQTHTRLMARLQTLEHAARQMSRQERDVAERILQGKMNRDIARELKVSDRTVERRRAAIMKHLNAATTPELVSKLVERDMLRTWTYSACDAQWQMARNSHLAVSDVAI